MQYPTNTTQQQVLPFGIAALKGESCTCEVCGEVAGVLNADLPKAIIRPDVPERRRTSILRFSKCLTIYWCAAAAVGVTGEERALTRHLEYHIKRPRLGMSDAKDDLSDFFDKKLEEFEVPARRLGSIPVKMSTRPLKTGFRDMEHFGYCRYGEPDLVIIGARPGNGQDQLSRPAPSEHCEE